MFYNIKMALIFYEYLLFLLYFKFWVPVCY